MEMRQLRVKRYTNEGEEKLYNFLIPSNPAQQEEEFGISVAITGLKFLSQGVPQCCVGMGMGQ